jgi:hypothetical protein
MKKLIVPILFGVSLLTPTLNAQTTQIGCDPNTQSCQSVPCSIQILYQDPGMYFYGFIEILYDLWILL